MENMKKPLNDPLGDGTEYKREYAVDEARALEAEETFLKYKSARQQLTARLQSEEKWWQSRQWELLSKGGSKDTPMPTSGWLVNAIINRHADAMDNIPEAIVRPRSAEDEESAEALSSILPVILELNGFSQQYSDAMWDKIKHGYSVSGVFFDADKHGGIGDIDLSVIDPINLYYEDGITDIQDSANVFVPHLESAARLIEKHPELKEKIGAEGAAIDLPMYSNSESEGDKTRAVVLDWYYKTYAPSGKPVLHFAQICSGVCLYSTENIDPETGIYEHGKYPFVIDRMYPIKGTPVGFGLIALERSPQEYIDRLDSNILEHSLIASKTRYFIRDSSSINEDELLDVNKPLVRVSGELSDTGLRAVQVPQMDGMVYQVQQGKIEELKQTSSNNDPTSGASPGGVTAAAAVRALQEAGNKASRDSMHQTFDAFADMVDLIIDDIRQFETDARDYRIDADDKTDGKYQFITFSGSSIQVQPSGYIGGNITYRKPEFDYIISTQRKNPYSEMAQNELALQLYDKGMFSVERAEEAIIAISLMSFDGKDKILEKIQRNAQLMQQLQQQQQQINNLSLIASEATGVPLGGAQ